MTVPIARVVATRYPTERAAAALLLPRPLLPRRAPAARPAARAAAGRDRADRRARPAGNRRGADGAVRRARRGRPGGLPRRPRRRFAVPGADGRPGRARAGPAAAARGACRRDFVGLDEELAAARSRPRPIGELLLERAPAPRRPGGARRTPTGAVADAVGEHARRARAARARRRRARDLRPRPGAQHRLLHGRRVRGLRPRARHADRRRRPLRRAARPLRPPAARRRLRARASTACTSRWRARSAAPGHAC